MSKRNMIIAGVAILVVAAVAAWFVLRPGTAPTSVDKTSGGAGTSVSPTSTGVPGESDDASASLEATGEVASVYVPIPTDGVHEKAALAAVPAALQTAAAKKKELGAEMPDLSGAAPTLTSYGLIGEIDKKYYLFQVFGDRSAYEYLRYPAKPDPANQYALDASGFAGEPLVDPVGARETAAAAAVKSLMDKGFPKAGTKVVVWNYGFTFIKKDGKPATLSNGIVFQITIDPKGKLSSME